MECISFGCTKLTRHCIAGWGLDWTHSGVDDGTNTIGEVVDHPGMRALQVSPDEIKAIIEGQEEKKRFHFVSKDGDILHKVPDYVSSRSDLRGLRIRCSQGHSRRGAAGIDMEKLMTKMYPGCPGWSEILTHGTVERCVEGIMEDGLFPGGGDLDLRAREHLHLVDRVTIGGQAGLRGGSTHYVRVDARKYWTLEGRS